LILILSNKIEPELKPNKNGQVKLHSIHGKASNALEETTGKKQKVNDYEGYTDSVWGDITFAWLLLPNASMQRSGGPCCLPPSNVDFSKVDDEAEEVRADHPQALVDI
jgi:hypothetical protein